MLRRLYGTNDIAFTFVSDELNGVTRDSSGHVHPLIPRSFTALSQAEEENGQSRIYLGIHWSFDKTASIALGRQVGDYVRSEEHTSELQSLTNLVCRLLLEKKKTLPDVHISPTRASCHRLTA